MEYYLIDEYENSDFKKPQLQDIKKLSKKDYCEVIKTENKEFPNMFFSSKWFIKEDFKELLEEFDEEIFGASLCLIQEKKRQIYYAINFYERKAISTKTQFNRINEIENLVIDKDKVVPFKIFCVNNKRKEFCIFSFEVVERLLSYGICDIKYIPVEVVKWMKNA